MKVQTSLEFLLAISIVSLLGLSALSLYSKELPLNKNLLSGFEYNNSNTIEEQASFPQNPQINIFIPLNSTFLSYNPVQIEAYGCSEGNLSVNLQSKTAIFSQATISSIVDNATIISDSFEPTLAGLNTINASYVLACGSSNASSTEHFNTYASTRSQSSSEMFASISSTNESVEYGIDNISQVVNLQESSHCTITNIYTGSIYTVPGQCGTPNAWDYMTYDGNCAVPPYWSYSMAYCTYPEPTGYVLSTIDGSNNTKIYNFSLKISTSLGMLSSNLTSGKNKSAIYLNGIQVGNATVENVYLSQSSSSPYLLRNKTETFSLSQTSYTAYQEAENSAYSTLSFYNSSSISGDVASSIQEAISSTDSSSSAILNSKTPFSSGDCSIINNKYVCNENNLFSYLINVSLEQPLGISNSILYYQGSDINLEER